MFNWIGKTAINAWNGVKNGFNDIFGTGDSSSRVQADKDREFNAEQAQVDRDYQTEMSNTAVQRRMEDLKQAGMNPLLAGMESGSAASAPTGSKASSNGSGASNNGIVQIVNKLIDKIPGKNGSAERQNKSSKIKPNDPIKKNNNKSNWTNYEIENIRRKFVKEKGNEWMEKQK